MYGIATNREPSGKMVAVRLMVNVVALPWLLPDCRCSHQRNGLALVVSESTEGKGSQPTKSRKTIVLQLVEYRKIHRLCYGIITGKAVAALRSCVSVPPMVVVGAALMSVVPSMRTALPLLESSEGTGSQPTEIHNGKERNALALVALDRCCSNQRNGLAVAVSELTKGKRSATKQ